MTSRRSFLQTTALSLAGATLARDGLSGHTLAAETAAKVATTPPLPPLNRFPRMMQDWLMRQVNAIENQGNLRRAALQTKADAEAYVHSTRERIRECFGPEPDKTPLNARTTGIV